MTQQEFVAFQERNFDAFCKKTIHNLSAYALRSYINSQKRSRTLDTLLMQEVCCAATEDIYQTYGKTFSVCGISVVVRDESIGECLQFLTPEKRDILLLSFFGNYSDTEIARQLGISNATVTYRKKDALKRLRVLMEARDHAK